MSLIKELKRRNVIRVAIAYAVVSWLVLQVANTLVPVLELSPSVTKTVFLILLLGFIPAMFFSWAFEITPEGIKKEKDVLRDESITKITAKKLDYVTIAAALGVAGLFAWQQMNPPILNIVNVQNTDVKEMDSPLQVNDGLVGNDIGIGVNDVLTQTDAASIAVLPFVDLSPNKNQEYFSDGIAEEILNVLVRIESLKVASRTSAFGFKGQEALGIPRIAEELNVRHVLEGSVRKAGNTVRITAQLIDAKTDVHLWSETYDRELTTENLFAVQDEIAGVIVKQLGVMLGEDNSQEVHRDVTTESVDAYELYLKANGLYHKRSGDNIPEIISLYEQAVAIDPDFAEAWAGLASVYLVVPGWNLGTEEEYYPKAKAAADKATLLNDKLSLPYTVRGGIQSESSDIIGAIQQMSKALELEPKNIQGLYFRGAIYIDLGYFEKAEKDLRRCLELDPNYEICRRFLSFVMLYQGKNELASELFDEGMLKGQDSYIDVFVNYYGAIGDKRSLSLLLSKLIADDDVMREIMYRFHTDNNISFTEFVQAFENNRPQGQPLGTFTLAAWAQWYPGDFFWNPHHPILRRPAMREKYLALRKKMLQENGIVDYWRKHGFPPQCKPVGEDDFECE